MVETVWQGEDYEIIINSAGRRHCRDRDTGVFVDMEKCLEERERLEERRGRPIKRGVKIASASEAADKYEEGIDRVGIDAWEDAMKCSTPACAATTLKSYKVKKGVSLARMKSSYKNAYS